MKGLIVGVGPGDACGVPAGAVRALARAASVLGVALTDAVVAELGREVVRVDEGREQEAISRAPGAALAAPDALAHRLAVRYPQLPTWPARGLLRARAIGAEVAALAEIGAHLRRECPWDRVQTPETIVPHTIEEAFEVAEAVASGEGLPDELGDLLFQAVFLSQLLEEEGTADLASVARAQAGKLVSRHPHVYGDLAASSAAGVLDAWERSKRSERSAQGIFHDLPAGLPALAYATKVQKRAGAVGFRFAGADHALAKLDEELAELRADPVERELGDLLFAAVAVARSLEVDPELALRASAVRFRSRVERAAELAADEGEPFETLDADSQLAWYAQARAEGAR